MIQKLLLPIITVFPWRVYIIRNIEAILSEGFPEVVYFMRNICQYDNYGKWAKISYYTIPISSWHVYICWYFCWLCIFLCCQLYFITCTAAGWPVCTVIMMMVLHSTSPSRFLFTQPKVRPNARAMGNRIMDIGCVYILYSLVRHLSNLVWARHWLRNLRWNIATFLFNEIYYTKFNT